METVLYWVLAIMTILGGFAALAYFWDKWGGTRKWTDRKKQRHREQLAAFLTEAQQLYKA
jgi:hypothetical protein